MKRKNKKLLTLMLAGACCAVAIGGTVAAVDNVVSYADETTTQSYALTSIFSTSSATVGVKDSKTAFTFTADGSSVNYKKNLALKWFSAKNEPKYLTLGLSLADYNFSELKLTLESESTIAAEDDKAINTISFKKVDSGLSIQVNEQTAVVVPVALNTEAAISLNEDGCGYGQFNVLFGGMKVGTFENVGASYTKYSTTKGSESNSLYMEAKLASGQTTAVYLHEINGQAFDGTSVNTSNNVIDNAPAVLVVNEQFNGFQLGSMFSLEYNVIDVLKGNISNDKWDYYQFDGTKVNGPVDADYKEITEGSANSYFMDTVFEKDGKKTSVYEVFGKEYVSLKITADDSYTEKDYDLSWYIEDEFKSSALETVNGYEYIVLGRNQQGATYKHITLNDTDKKNVYDEVALQTQVDAYQVELAKAAEETSSGSETTIKFPALDWLINDDNGYSNLKFTICYNSPSSTKRTSSASSPSALKLSTSDAGWYEFKVFATDKAGNPMMYYDENGELVEITSTNIWDFEEIPTFKFEIAKKDMSVKNATSTSSMKSDKVLNETYTFSDATLVGVDNKQKEYKLYKLNALPTGVTESDLTKVDYETLNKNAKEKIKAVSNKDYFTAYIEAYAEELAKKIGTETVSAASIKAMFDGAEIQAYNDRIKEENAEDWAKSDNKYNWNATSASFTAAEEGIYVVVADYWENELPRQRVGAYKIVIVDSEADVIKGETEWLQNNIVSVVLFSIAAVMLILIIILLLVKPSDETLEDMDAKAAKKAKAKKEKKAKKSE